MQLPPQQEWEPAVVAAREGFGLAVDVVTPLPSWNSSVFRLDTATGRYALRVHRSHARLEGHIRGELAFLRHLTSHRIHVPDPVSSFTGEDVLISQASDGSPRYYDITRWLEGTVRRPRHGLDVTDAQQLGTTLGDVHLASRAFAPQPQGRPTLGDPTWLLSGATADDVEPIASWFGPDDRALLEDVIDRVRPALASLSSEERQSGAIHQDFILGNCVWQQGVLGILDFADWGVGPFLYDLAPMLTNIGDQPRMRAAFLTGYRSRQPLSGAQEAVLPLLEAVRHVSFCFRSIDKAMHDLPTPPLDVHLPVRIAEIRLLQPFA